MAASAQTPKRRVPGPLFVAAIAAAIALAAVPVYLYRPAPRLGPALLLIVITDVITATPDDVTLPVDFGPHCSPFTWTPKDRILTADADAPLADVEGLVFQRFNPSGGRFLWTGGDAIRSTLKTGGSGWALTSPIDNRTIASFDRSGENITVEGRTYEPGQTGSVLFAYDISTAGGTVRIEENLVLTNEGVVRPHIVPPPLCA